MIVFLLVTVILWGVYKIFFSQAKMVAQSMEYMKVNDNFRRILAHLGNDIREATQILFPNPVKLEEAGTLTTPKAPCKVLQLIKQEIDPSLKFEETMTSSPLATDTFGQIIRVREIFYELEPYKNAEDEESSTVVPRYRLVRLEYLKEKNKPNTILMQKNEIAETVRDFVLYRTVRKPMKALDIKDASERLLDPIPSYDAGTGNSVIHLKISLERMKAKGKGDAYEISLTTSFYKRGKEVFFHQ